METKDTFTYLEALGKQESSGRYYVKNWANYLGMYQMGEAALTDAGYYKPSNKKYDDNINHWDGEFTGKNNVFSVEDFLCNIEAQEDAIRIYQAKTWKTIKDIAEKYDGKIINGIKMTKSGMLAGAHLVGHVRLRKYLESNGNYIPQDGNKISIEKYIKDYAGYDVSEIINYKPQKQELEDPIEQVLINQIMTKFDGIYSRSEITKLVRDTLSQTPTENLMNKSKEITKQENSTPQRKKNYSNSSSADGKWVTINGNHVLIEK